MMRIDTLGTSWVLKGFGLFLLCSSATQFQRNTSHITYADVPGLCYHIYIDPLTLFQPSYSC